MAIKEATVPDIGNYDKVPVIEVLVKPGDVVRKDQGLITLESDKATMEVPAPFDGRVKALKVKLGDELSTGAVVALIEETDSSSAAVPQPPVVPKIASADTYKEAPSASVDSVSTSVSASSTSSVAEIVHTPHLDAEVAAPRTPPMAFDAQDITLAQLPHASPAIRLFARELGADLAKITGTGRKGRITREDVQSFVKQALSGTLKTMPASAGAGTGLNLLPWPQVDFSKFGEIENKSLSRIKKISGANLARNWAMIPHVTQHDEADITEMEAFRKSVSEQYKDVKVTPLVFLIKAVVAALRKFPAFNASLDATGENLILKHYFHIGIAVDTPDGLVVPVIRDCDKKGLIELAKEMAEISAKARDKKLGPADMSGGCFSISSLGGIGGVAFTPIINAPEVAILGVSKSQTKPVWNGKEFAPRLMLPLSLSYDHRVIDGAEAARFTAYLAQTLGDIRRLLL